MQIEPGEVRLYPYLWARERDRGETEGRKDRRCAETTACCAETVSL